MEEQIFKLLRENKIGHAKAWYITRELLCLYNVINLVCSAPKGECDRKPEDVCKECDGCPLLKQTCL